jgi:hypothetical protein
MAAGVRGDPALPTGKPPPRQQAATGVALSVLVHGLVLAVLVMHTHPFQIPQETPTVTLELLPPLVRPPPIARPKPPPPKPKPTPRPLRVKPAPKVSVTKPVGIERLIMPAPDLTQVEPPTLAPTPPPKPAPIEPPPVPVATPPAPPKPVEAVIPPPPKPVVVVRPVMVRPSPVEAPPTPVPFKLIQVEPPRPAPGPPAPVPSPAKPALRPALAPPAPKVADVPAPPAKTVAVNPLRVDRPASQAAPTLSTVEPPTSLVAPPANAVPVLTSRDVIEGPIATRPPDRKLDAAPPFGEAAPAGGGAPPAGGGGGAVGLPPLAGGHAYTGPIGSLPNGLRGGLSQRLGCLNPEDYHLSPAERDACLKRVGAQAQGTPYSGLNIPADKQADYDRNVACRKALSGKATPGVEDKDPSTANLAGLGHDPGLSDCGPGDR